jgi:hypothetical protein
MQKRNSVMSDLSTEPGSDDGFLSESDISALAPPIRRVRFADEVAGASLVVVKEVECWKQELIAARSPLPCVTSLYGVGMEDLFKPSVVRKQTSEVPSLQCSRGQSQPNTQKNKRRQAEDGHVPKGTGADSSERTFDNSSPFLIDCAFRMPSSEAKPVLASKLGIRQRGLVSTLTLLCLPAVVQSVHCLLRFQHLSIGF